MDMDDRIGINVEGDLNLGDTSVGRRNANELEVSQELVVTDQFTFALVDLDLNSSLKVGSGGEDLRLLCGNGSITIDQASEDASKCLNSEREGGNVEQENIHDLAGENRTLDSCTHGHSFIRVNGLGRVPTEDALD